MIVIVNSESEIIKESNNIFLLIDHWNDYFYYTLFHLFIVDNQRNIVGIGAIKIGFEGQTEGQKTHRELIKLKEIDRLPKSFFSLGYENFYKNIFKHTNTEQLSSILDSLNDIVYKPQIISDIQNEEVFKISFLRGVSLNRIKNTYPKLLNGDSPLTDFNFFFKRQVSELSSIELEFEIKAESTPSTNIHALIGRNGVGKTTILNNIIDSIANESYKSQLFYNDELEGVLSIDKGFFSTLLSVSFSAFDPFEPPKENSNPALGTCYYYIGLRDTSDINKLKSRSELNEEFCKSFMELRLDKYKLQKWKESVRTLESDNNFSSMDLLDLSQQDKKNLSEKEENNIKKIAINKINHMSSGHAIVLLTITRLVEKVEEKSLVLIDEPESHLHPPLLSAFIRALSNLLTSRNGVAIIATHSPVVLQETPKSCVWKINRSGNITLATRPQLETFGENVGVLTRDVFGLEVNKSGFYNLLREAVDDNKNIDEILKEYNNQIGFEGRVALANLVNARDLRDKILNEKT